MTITPFVDKAYVVTTHAKNLEDGSDVIEVVNVLTSMSDAVYWIDVEFEASQDDDRRSDNVIIDEDADSPYRKSYVALDAATRKLKFIFTVWVTEKTIWKYNRDKEDS